MNGSRLALLLTASISAYLLASGATAEGDKQPALLEVTEARKDEIGFRSPSCLSRGPTGSGKRSGSD